MGTRSTIKFLSEWGKNEPILTIYQQYDGYISGVGRDLAKFLKKKTVINGISSQTMKNYANGMGCLAAQYLKSIKKEIGGVYCTWPEDEQEFNYTVRLEDGQIKISVDDFDGTPEELLKYSEPED